TIDGRYVQSINLDGSQAENLPARPDVPRLLQLEHKLRLAALGSADVASYRSRLEMVARPVDAERLAAIVERFLPRFHKFWISERPKLNQQAHAFARVLGRPDLLQLSTQAAHFYAAEIRSP